MSRNLLVACSDQTVNVQSKALHRASADLLHHRCLATLSLYYHQKYSELAKLRFAESTADTEEHVSFACGPVDVDVAYLSANRSKLI